MPLSISDVSFHKSGDAMLGGAIGTALASQEVVQPVIVTGVYVAKAFSNALGPGTLSYSPVTQTLMWRAAGSAVTASSQPISASGTYVIGAPATGVIVVAVASDQLPTSYKVESLRVTEPIHTVFGETTTLMALVGDVQYRCVYFRNNHSTLAASDARLYLHRLPSGAQSLAIGVDPSGVGDGLTTGVAQTVASAYSAPAGVVFSAPVLAAEGLPLGTLGPNQSIAVWQRLTTSPMAYGGAEVVAAAIGVALVG